MGRMGKFKNEATRERYLSIYDTLVAQWPVPAEEIDVPTQFGSTRVRRWGEVSDAPVVLLHPNLGTSLGWSTFAEALGRDNLVLAVDTIGAVGRTVQTQPLDGPGDLSPWLAEVLAGLGVDEPVHLVGYSEGGWVALQAAAGGDVRLASMMVIEPAGIHAFRLRFIASMAAAGSAAARAMRRSGTDGGALRAFALRMVPSLELSEQSWDLMITGALGFTAGLPLPRKMKDAQLRSITVPTLLYLGGDSELYDPQKAAARAQALLSSVEVEIVPGVGHGLPLVHPERTIRAALDFMARHPIVEAPLSDTADMH